MNKSTRSLLFFLFLVVFAFGMGLGFSQRAVAGPDKCCWFITAGCDTTWGVDGPGGSCDCHPIFPTTCRIECGSCE